MSARNPHPRKAGSGKPSLTAIGTAPPADPLHTQIAVLQNLKARASSYALHSTPRRRTDLLALADGLPALSFALTFALCASLSPVSLNGLACVNRW